jgi:hypothetical protein
LTSGPDPAAAWQRFELFLDCMIGERPRGEPDDITLGITLDLSSAAPRFHSADVCWGHPSGQIVGEIAVRGIPYTDESLAVVEAGLPALFAALREAILRGSPTQANLFPY